MRDSVDAYLTAYNTEGSDAVGYPYGQLPQYPLTDIPMSGFADFTDDVLARMGESERKLIAQELATSDSFKKHFSNLLRASDPVKAIGEDAMKAVVNEFNSKDYPETKGQWQVLRGTIRNVVGNIHSMLVESAKDLTPSERQRLIDSITAGDFTSIGLGADAAAPVPAAGGDFLSSLIGTLGTSLTTIYGAQLQAHAAQNIAQINAQSAQNQAAAAQQTAQLQQQMAAAQAAMSGGSSSVSSGFMTGTVGGIPTWALAAGGVGIVGLILLMALKK